MRRWLGRGVLGLLVALCLISPSPGIAADPKSATKAAVSGAAKDAKAKAEAEAPTLGQVKDESAAAAKAQAEPAEAKSEVEAKAKVEPKPKAEATAASPLSSPVPSQTDAPPRQLWKDTPVTLSSVPWALFWAFAAFLVTTQAQGRSLSENLVDDRQSWLKNGTEWRFITVFTALLAAITLTQFWYAALSSGLVVRGSVEGFWMGWLFFVVGLCPLPVLLTEVYCIATAADFGITRHYHNNLRMAGGRWARWSRFLEGRLRRSGGRQRLNRWVRRKGWKLADWLLTYVLSTAFFLHITANFGAKEWEERPIYTVTQLVIDAVAWACVWAAIIALLGLGLMAVSETHLVAEIVSPQSSFWGLLPYAYFGVAAVAVVAANAVMLQSRWEGRDVGVGGRGFLDALRNARGLPGILWAVAKWGALFLSVVLVVGTVGWDVWTAGSMLSPPPLPKRWFHMIFAIDPEILILNGLYKIQVACGGFAPAAFAIVLYRIMFFYHDAVQRVAQSIGGAAGDRVPFFMMKSARHRLGNILVPVAASLSATERALPSIDDQAMRDYLARSLGRSGKAMREIQEWFEEMRAIGARVGEAEDDVEEAVLSASEIVNGAASALRDFLTKEENRSRPQIHVEASVAPEVADWLVRLPNQGGLWDALANLTTNAAESLWDKGTYASGAKPTIWIEARLRKSRIYPLVLLIRDNGQGVPEVLKDTIFEPFQTTKANGTGMGLYVTRLHFQRLGGDVGLDCHQNAQFIIEIPRDRISDRAT